MQYQSMDGPPRQRSSGFYVLWGCGGCACVSVIVAFVSVFLLSWGVKRGLEGMSAMVREAKVDLKVQKHKMVTRQKARFIVGTLKNVSPTHTYAIASVEFSLFDKSGQPLKSASAEIEHLKPGAIWDFKVPVADPTAVTYKFHEVGGVQDITEDPNLDPRLRARLKEEQAKFKQRIDADMKKAQEDSVGQKQP